MADTNNPPPPPPPSAEADGGEAGKKPIWKRWWFIGGIILLIILIAASGGGGDDEGDTAAVDTDTTEADAADDTEDTNATEDSDTEETTEDQPEEEPEPEPEPAASEADDITGCTVAGEDTIDIAGTNNSSKQSSYLLTVVFTSGGERVSDEPFFINYVRPGESFVENTYAFSLEAADACEVVDVDRNSAESPDDVSEVTCEITGTDVLGSISGKMTATNGSSKDSDYMATAALVRDGVRIGTAMATMENVRPGESAPADMLTTVEGPADGVTCDVVHVERTAS